MMPHVLSAITLLLCLAGCSLTPSYTRPTPPVPQKWPAGSSYGDTTAGQAASPRVHIEWRTFYADQKLRRVIDLALANNRDLRIAALNIDRAKALYRIQRAELLPSVGASGGLTEQRVSADMAESGEAYNSRKYSVNLGVASWELDFFGRLRSLKDYALEHYLATEQAAQSLQLSLTAEVANAYLSLAADRENLKLAQDTLASQQTSYGLIERRFSVGASSELDLRQAQTRLEAAKGDIALYTGRVTLDENALTLLVGSPLPAELLPEQLNGEAVLGSIAFGTPSEVLLRRPDILEAEHFLRAANANIGAARAAFFPRIMLSGALGTTSDELSRLFTAGASGWTFTPQVSMPIFDARVWSALQGIKAEKEIAVAQYEKAIQAAFREVSDVLAQKASVAKRIRAQQSLVDATAATYSLANARYKAGVDSYLPLLDAQRSLYSAQQGLITLRLAGLTNLVSLFKVLGGGAEQPEAREMGK